MNILALVKNIFRPSKKQALAHKETAFSVGSGLLTQAPLMVFLMWFMREVLLITDWWVLSSTNVIFMTITSYVRVYYTRMYFSGRYDDIEDTDNHRKPSL